MRAEKKGALLVFLAAVLYSIGGLCIKLIPWSAMSINGGRNIVAVLVVGGYLLIARHKPKWNRGVVLGAICVSGTNILFTIANKLTTAANAIVLQFTAPIFVLLLSVLFLHKKPSKLDMAVCAAVLTGVICFFLESLGAGDALGNVVALGSGLSYAGVFMLNDMPNADPISSVFWGDIFSAVVGLPFLLCERDFSLVPMISLIVLGAFQVGLAYILMCQGLKTTPAVTASLLSGIEPVLNPVLVALFYHESVGPLAFLGAVIVVGSIVIYNLLLARTPSERQPSKEI